MNRLSLLLIVLVGVSAVSSVGAVGSDIDEGQGPLTSTQSAKPASWNLSVERRYGEPAVIARGEHVTFYSMSKRVEGEYFPSVVVASGTGEDFTVHANLLVDRSTHWTEKTPKKFTGRTVGDTLVTKYGGRMLAISKQSGEWTITDLEPLDSRFQTLFASDTAVYLATEHEIRQYIVDGTPSLANRYRTDNEISMGHVYDSRVVVREDRPAGADCDGGGGCLYQANGGYVRGLTHDLDEVWSQSFTETGIFFSKFARESVVVTTESSYEIYGFDVDSGKTLWTWEHATDVLPLIDPLGANVEMEGDDGKVHVIDSRTGTERWLYPESSVQYANRTRIFQYQDGEYRLLDRSDGTVLGTYAGTQPNDMQSPFRWDTVDSFAEGRILGFTTDAAPERMFIDSVSGDVITTLEPGPELRQSYESETTIHTNLRTLNDDGLFIRTYRPDELFLYSDAGGWVKQSIGGTDSLPSAPSVAKVGDKYVYVVKTGTPIEWIQVRALDGTYLGQAFVYRTDVNAPMNQTVEYPQLPEDHIENDEFTREAFDIGAADGGEPRLRYHQSGGSVTHWFDILALEKEGEETTGTKITGSIDEGQTSGTLVLSVDVDCDEVYKVPRAGIMNPSDRTIIVGVEESGNATQIRSEAGSFVLLSRGETATFYAETLDGERIPMELDVYSLPGGEVVDSNTLRAGTCGQDVAGDTRTETPGFGPGFAILGIVVVSLITRFQHTS